MRAKKKKEENIGSDSLFEWLCFSFVVLRHWWIVVITRAVRVEKLHLIFRSKNSQIYAESIMRGALLSKIVYEILLHSRSIWKPENYRISMALATRSKTFRRSNFLTDAIPARMLTPEFFVSVLKTLDNFHGLSRDVRRRIFCQRKSSTFRW